MRIDIQNRTYRNANADGLARVIVTGTDALRKQLVDAFFPARHVRHTRPSMACFAARLRQAKQAGAGAARTLEPTSSSMSGPQGSISCGQPQRWAAERGSPRAFVTSA